MIGRDGGIEDALPKGRCTGSKSTLGKRTPDSSAGTVCGTNLGAAGGRQEAAVYRHEHCRIFWQIVDHELTNTIRLAAKITLKCQRTSHKHTVSNCSYVIDLPKGLAGGRQSHYGATVGK